MFRGVEPEDVHSRAVDHGDVEGFQTLVVAHDNTRLVRVRAAVVAPCLKVFKSNETIDKNEANIFREKLLKLGRWRLPLCTKTF